ncbi:hypothetical protein IC575_014419 [Cucumis melo]
MWLSSLETIFRYMKCPENQKVQCAVFMLIDRGTTWWETTERMLGGDVSQITWEQFKDSFYAKFFSASLRDAKWQEFLNLEQDDRTVEQYDAKFDMLSRFALEMIATEAARADKFVRGLRLDIQGLQRPFEAGEVARGKPLCTTCGKHHLGRCLFGTRTCFKCRQEGHTADRCPMRLTGSAQNQGAGAQHKGKVFATNKTEAERAGTVVTGTLPVLGHYALVLFDSGSSHSFISAMRANKLLSQSTWSILASVVDTREVDVSLSSEPVVRDYPDVFPEELLGLPLHREIEFAALTELKELKV